MRSATEAKEKGRIAGLERAAQIVEEMADFCVSGGDNEEAEFLRLLAQDIRDEKDVAD